MDRATANSRADFINADPPSTCRNLASPDQEARGRRRRRDPLDPFPLSRHSPSESSTLRGRCRHRSASRMNLAALSRINTTTGPAPHSKSQRGDSPEGRLLAPGIVVVRSEVPRGRSPSRSGSPDGGAQADMVLLSPVMAQRRRQRTKSRSRRLRLEGPFASAALAGRPSLGFEGWVAEHGVRSGKD